MHHGCARCAPQNHRNDTIPIPLNRGGEVETGHIDIARFQAICSGIIRQHVVVGLIGAPFIGVGGAFEEMIILRKVAAQREKAWPYPARW